MGRGTAWSEEEVGLLADAVGELHPRDPLKWNEVAEKIHQDMVSLHGEFVTGKNGKVTKRKRKQRSGKDVQDKFKKAKRLYFDQGNRPSGETEISESLQKIGEAERSLQAANRRDLETQVQPTTISTFCGSDDDEDVESEVDVTKSNQRAEVTDTISEHSNERPRQTTSGQTANRRVSLESKSSDDLPPRSVRKKVSYRQLEVLTKSNDNSMSQFLIFMIMMERDERKADRESREYEERKAEREERKAEREAKLKMEEKKERRKEAMQYVQMMKSLGASNEELKQYLMQEMQE